MFPPTLCLFVDTKLLTDADKKQCENMSLKALEQKIPMQPRNDSYESS